MVIEQKFASKKQTAERGCLANVLQSHALIFNFVRPYSRLNTVSSKFDSKINALLSIYYCSALLESTINDILNAHLGPRFLILNF